RLTGRKLRHVAFPLGGIGTGSVSLGGWGQLRDWEIMNRPAKGATLWFTFFALKVDTGRGESVIRVLQGPSQDDFIGTGSGAVGREIHTGGQLPPFRNCSFRGTFPFARVSLADEHVPVDVSLEAFNPFIPLNEKDSSVPVAMLRYTLRNTSKRAVVGTVSGNLCNPINVLASGPEAPTTVNEKRRDRALTGLWLTAHGLDPAHPRYGSMVLATPWRKADVAPRWPYPHALNARKALMERRPFPGESRSDIGTVRAHFSLAPGESVTIPFHIAWHFPNYEFPFDQIDRTLPIGKPKSVWKNYYATVWADAWDVASYVERHAERLEAETRRFHDALFASTLPGYVLDAVSSQLSTLKTTTCLRLTDGTFYGFEGSADTQGTCPGSCTHVWNYAQALPYLFPALQRSMREADYRYAMRADGMGQFRLPLPLGTKADWLFHPSADGQMGGVIQVYREWLIGGDTEWLRGMWPATKKALEFAWKYWDPNRDGVMEGAQHVTYDYEYHGANPLAGLLYLAALRAAEEMAKVMGEGDKAAEYRRLFVSGSRWFDRTAFNGEYYEQRVNPRAVDLIADSEPWKHASLANPQIRADFPWIAQQLRRGCLSDQLLGQWYARMLGLGSLVDEGHAKEAARSVFKYNWKPDLTRYEMLSGSRLFARHEEAGLLLCGSPKDRTPDATQYLADELWTGIEYAAAAAMIHEGLLEEGLTIVRGVRERYTGEYRNPWDEMECGHHYARAMASYSLLLALSGFRYSAPEKRMEIVPKMAETKFATFFSVGSGWGRYRQNRTRGSMTAEIRLDYGHLDLAVFRLEPKGAIRHVAATCNGKAIAVSFLREGRALDITLAPALRIEQGMALRLVLS
ncbi:MAG: GH116 family glycosyl hydrolase, partial [Kiritimatiellae bacterium]|nr:GH116 family glycosyl hydrolase [Kiritimatiellia bacterium]